MILRCSCEHKIQDQYHGIYKRVHNPLKKDRGRQQEWRCTVCKKTKTGPEQDQIK